MPSLKALEEFKTSFLPIGGEDRALADDSPFTEDFPLPEHESAAPEDSSAGQSTRVGSSVPSPADGGVENLDLDNLGDLLDDLGPVPDGTELPDLDELLGSVSGEDAHSDDLDLDSLLGDTADESPADAEDTSNLAFPEIEETDELLSPDSGEAGDSALPKFDDADNAGQEGLDQDFDALGPDGFELPEEDPAVPAEELKAPEDNFNIPDEAPPDGAPRLDDVADIPELEESADEPAAPPVSGNGGPNENKSLNLFTEPRNNLNSQAEPDNAEALDELDGVFDEEETFAPSGEVASGDSSFDGFSLDGDSLGDNFNLPNDTAADDGVDGDFAKLEEFSLPGIDDIFSKETKAAKRAARTPVREGTSDEVEEIQLSDEEFEKLQRAIASYPLNLRIAIEEIIAEQVVPPDLMSGLVKMLVRGAPAKEAASMAGRILGRSIAIPKGFEKKTGEELEAEQASFRYIFIHNFLPVFRLFVAIAILTASVSYLAYQFIVIPLYAQSIYSRGYKLLNNGNFQQAKERFSEAFYLWQDKEWFYKYALAFEKYRQYDAAAEKYDELLFFYPMDRKRLVEFLATEKQAKGRQRDSTLKRVLDYTEQDIKGPRDKKGVLLYAAMETGRGNYARADTILRRKYLDYAEDRDVRLALGDNALLWGDEDPSRYEYARESFALLLDKRQTDPVLERMLLYFIRIDSLKEVLPLQNYFMASPKRTISAASLSELGGYLLDKKFEVVEGVPDEYLEYIQGIRDVLVKAASEAVRAQAGDADRGSLPITYYHLARYYNFYGNAEEERQVLKAALDIFEAAQEESPKRLRYWIDARRRYAQCLINERKFFPAQEELTKGLNRYESSLKRDRLDKYTASPEFGGLYADLGDLMYFTRTDGQERALEYYNNAERIGWKTPEMVYRMGAAHYRLEEWEPSLARFYEVFSETPLNKRILYALGNVSYQRGDYFAAQNYYTRLLNLLDTERNRFSLVSRNNTADQLDLAERIMVARNNIGVTYEALTMHSGSPAYRSQALRYYTESSTAWEFIARDRETMVRPFVKNYAAPGTNLGFLNTRNALYPRPGYEPQLYVFIDKDMEDNSFWENLVPSSTYLSDVPNKL
ncbi:MAG: tetratricopeptide repeat protein [Treponema sp.]|jgi:tetratricopeptide (TPR) repeat protein|nr:tetratricopeptide repeat protein [Treponema sp.]